MDHSTSGKHTWEIVQDEKESHQRIGGPLCITSSPTGKTP